MFAVVSFAVLVTAGSAAGAVASTIAAVDSAATRSVIVRSEPGHGLPADAVARLSRIDAIASVTAFGPPRDARNAGLPEGSLVAVLPVWSLTEATPRASPGVFVSPRASTALGLAVPSGALRTSTGEMLTVAGAVDPPGEWAFLEPLVVQPVDDLDAIGPVATVVVVADRIAAVPAVVAVVRSLLGAGAAPVDIQSTSALADLHTQIEFQVAGFGHVVTVGVLSATAALASGLLTVIAVLTRRDTARRRALGARRSTLAALVVVQAAGCALVGHTLGSIVALVVLALTASPFPPIDVVVAVGLVSVGVAVVSALLPVLVVVTRDPVRELRVP
jgi:putative ABC transport system permease protein